MTKADLIEPYKGAIVDLLVDDQEAQALRLAANDMESVVLSDRLQCDLEMLAVGGFSPLQSFMGQDDYRRVVTHMRLADGTLFPIPITLHVDKKYEIGQELALRDTFGDLLAVVTVSEIYRWDREEYAKHVLGSDDPAHPLVDEMRHWGPYNVTGELKVVSLPKHEGFLEYRLTPLQVRDKLARLGSEKVVAFQTRNPLHRAHEELTKKAVARISGSLLLHPVVGITKPGDVDSFTRVRCYKALVDNYYPESATILSLLPLAMRMAGPREALWHAIIRRNYGANHFIVGRDHAGPGKTSKGEPFYGPYDAQRLVKQHENELGIKVLAFNEMAYAPEKDQYVELTDELDVEVIHLSGTQVREEYLAKGRALPAWFTRPEVASILQEVHPPRQKQGFCVWFTGLSGAGKSTLAQALETRLREMGRSVTMLDGDVVRTHLSYGLGFSKEDRDTNVKRIGYVASQVVRHNGVAVCAAISPYIESRQVVRNYFEPDHFIEVYVSTPMAVCERRDIKGLYNMARQGKLAHFTGVSDAYELPENPELTVDTSVLSVDQAVERIIDLLTSKKYGYLE